MLPAGQIPRDRLHDQRRLEVPALKVVLGPMLQLVGNRTQDHGVPPNRRAKLTAMPDEPSTPEICDRPDATGQRFRQRYPLLLGPRQSTVNAILKETLNGTQTFLSQHVSSVAPSSSRHLAVQHEQAE